MKTYFTFGYDHIHKINHVVLDCDVVLCIETETRKEARGKMFELFGDKWSFQYNEPPDMNYFPRGVIYLDR